MVVSSLKLRLWIVGLEVGESEDSGTSFADNGPCAIAREIVCSCTLVVEAVVLLLKSSREWFPRELLKSSREWFPWELLKSSVSGFHGSY